LRLSVDQLCERLRRGELAPLYCLSGEEPLQMTEACDAVRAAARDAGAIERVVLEVGAGFDWTALAAAAATYSLFSSRRLIELRLPGGKPGTEGAAALRDYAARAAGEDVLLVTTGKLDRAESTAWYRALERAGVTVQIWPIRAHKLPQWLRRRGAALGLNLSEEAAQWLAEQSEGNLLAATQELEKLRLFSGGGRIGVGEMVATVADSARFNIFELLDAALEGQAGRCLRILDGLRAEGLAVPAVGWLLARELRTLARLADAIATGEGENAAMAQAGVRPQKEAQFRAALRRHGGRRIRDLLRLAARLDRTAKGATGGLAWDELTWLCLGIAGARIAVLERPLLT
jgi:DNA polymerase-3 subunit delta